MTSLNYNSPKPRGSAQVGFTQILWTIAAKREYALALVISLIIGIVSIRNLSFLSSSTLGGILVNCAQPAIVACGVMLVIVTGEIDISVGGNMAFLTALIGILMSKHYYPIWAGWVANGFHDYPPGATQPAWTLEPFSVPSAILITLFTGTLIGFFNGLLVTIVRVPSIIVTLGMMTILKGLTKLIMTSNISDVPESFHTIGTGSLFGDPVNSPTAALISRYSIWIAVAVVVCTFILIKYTPLGRRIFAVGSNPHAAALSGISEKWIKIFAFTLTGFLVGVATLITSIAVFDNTGEVSELLIVTCVVVGGVSISGGTGTVLGVMLGVILLLMQKTVLIFLNLAENASNWDKAIQGALILGAVLVDHLASSRAKKSGGAH